MSKTVLKHGSAEHLTDAVVTRDRLYEKYRSYRGTTNSADERERRAPYIRSLIRNHFPADLNSRVLEIGCGNGLLLHFLRQAGYSKLTGIDSSAEQIDAARAQGLVDVHSADVFTFLAKVRSESYDVVVAFDVIEHLTREELLRVADEIYRVLAPQGRWLIHAPNAEGFFGSRVRYADLTHEQAFTRGSIEQLTRAAAFRGVECFEDEPVIHGLRSAARWLVWKGMGIVVRAYLMAETGERRAILSQNLLARAYK